jgi:hypothetical protein
VSSFAVSNESEEREPQRRHRSSDLVTGTQWFYDVLGQVFGPLSSAELLAKVKAGEIAANTPVRKDDSQWVNAEDVNGLFEAALKNKPFYKCPYCGGKIDKPPTTCLNCDRDVNAAYRVRQSQAEAQQATDTNRIVRPPVEKTNGSNVRTFFKWFKSLLDDGS